MHRFSRRLCASIVAIGMLFALSMPGVAIAEETEQPPALNEATAACLTDAYGNVLYDLNAEEEMPMASITKVMTAMVALDAEIPLDTHLTFVSDEYQDDAQLAGFRDGDDVTFGELLMVTLVYSGNDAATNLAYAVAGDEETFVALMNTKAKALGLEHTHFANPHGLEQDGHYSCAADLCEMGRYAMEHYPVIRQAVQTRSIDVTIDGYPVTLYSTDELMETYAGLVGIKTGKTESGASFLGSARRGHVTLYSCVLCCESSQGRFDDSAVLLDWGYDHYDTRELTQQGWVVRIAPWQDGFWLKCPVTALHTVNGLVARDGGMSYTTVMSKPNVMTAPRTTYGTTVWRQNDRLVGSAEYRSAQTSRVSAWSPVMLPLFEDKEGA